MATQTEVLQIVQQVTGADEVARLIAEEKRLKAALEAVIAPLHGMDAAALAANASVQRAATDLARTSRELATAEKALTRAGGSAGNASYRFMQLGQTLDDLQYVPEMGLRPITNNLMSMDARLGIVVLAADTLYRNWGNISKLWGAGETRTEAERMEELGKKTAKTAEETAKLAAYEKQRAAIQASAGGSKAQTEAQAAVANVVKEAAEGDRTGQEVLAQQIAVERAKRNGENFLNAEDKEKLAAIDAERRSPHMQGVSRARAAKAGQTLDEYFESQRAKIRADAEKREVEQAAKDIAPTNKRGREQAAAEMRRLGRDDLARGFLDADPETIKRKAQEAEYDKVMAARNKEEQERDQKFADDTNARNEERRKRALEAINRNADKAAGGLTEPIEKQILANNANDDSDPRNRRIPVSELRSKLLNQIEKSLADAQFPPGEVKMMAPAILDKIIQGTTDKIRNTSFSEGIDPRKAAQVLLTERQTKAAEDQLRAQDRAAQEARSRVGNIDHDVDVELMRGVFMGGKPGDVGKRVTSQLEAVLKKRGMNDEDASLAARKLVFDAGERRAQQERATRGSAFAGPMLMTRQQAAIFKQTQARGKRQAAINRKRFAATDAAVKRRMRNTFVAVQPPRVTEGKDFTSKLDRATASTDELTKALNRNSEVQRDILNRGVNAVLQ